MTPIGIGALHPNFAVWWNDSATPEEESDRVGPTSLKQHTLYAAAARRSGCSLIPAYLKGGEVVSPVKAFHIHNPIRRRRRTTVEDKRERERERESGGGGDISRSTFQFMALARPPSPARAALNER